MAYTVRRTRADEWREFRELRLEALEDSPTNFGQTHEQALAMPDETGRSGRGPTRPQRCRPSIVAVDDTTGKLLGMWGVMPHNAHPGVHHVLGVYVRPEARGTEVARLLNQACMDFARTTDAKELTLLVRDDNDRGAASTSGRGSS